MVNLDLKEYEKNLERALSSVPKEKSGRDRFELTRLQVTLTGNRTVITNFKEICDYLNRDPQHVLKFLSAELATAATIEGGRIVFQGKFSDDGLTKLLNRYVQDFVICPACTRPDTKITKEGRISFLVCEACGAKSSIRHI
jgi:translation initiation factor 2 subunit 2